MKKGPALPHAHREHSLAVTKKEGTTAPGAAPILGGALRAFPITLLTGLVLLLIVTAIAYTQTDPDAYLTPLAIGATMLTAVIAGFLTARFNRGAGLLSGLLAGILFVSFIMLLSLLCFREGDGSGYSAAVCFFLHAGALLASVLGAILGVPHKKAPTPGKHRKKH